MDNIIFAGDSFTWGEGLEFYQEIPKWVEQRTKPSEFNQYVHLIDEESIQFRESNRFAGLVSKYFNLLPIIQEMNGGGFDKLTTLVNDNINENTKFVILQITSIFRMELHIGLNLRKSCCEYCISCGKPPFSFYNELMEKILNGNTITNNDIKWINQLGFVDLDTLKNLKNPFEIIKYLEGFWKKNINSFYTDWILNWQKQCPVFIIDSWDYVDTSSLLHNHPEISKLLIPLKGMDNNWYTKWKDWENTFEYPRIQYQFPNTDNGHPTLIQHQYLAESIIEKLNKHG